MIKIIIALFIATSFPLMAIDRPLELVVPSSIYVQDSRYPTHANIEVQGIQSSTQPYFITVSRGGFSDYNAETQLDRLARVRQTRVALQRSGEPLGYALYKSINEPVELEDRLHATQQEQVIEGRMGPGDHFYNRHPLVVVVPAHQEADTGVYEDVVTVRLFEGTFDNRLMAQELDNAQIKIRIPIQSTSDFVLNTMQPSVEKGWIYFTGEIRSNEPVNLMLSLGDKGPKKASVRLDGEPVILTRTPKVLCVHQKGSTFIKLGFKTKDVALIKALEWSLDPVQL